MRQLGGDPMQIKDYIRTERFMGEINAKIIELLPYALRMYARN